MEQQQHGFSNSTPRVDLDSDRSQKSAKSLLSALQLMSIIHISTQKYGSGHFDQFLITRKIRRIGERLKNHSDQSEYVKFEIIFLLIS